MPPTATLPCPGSDGQINPRLSQKEANCLNVPGGIDGVDKSCCSRIILFVDVQPRMTQEELKFQLGPMYIDFVTFSLMTEYLVGLL